MSPAAAITGSPVAACDSRRPGAERKGRTRPRPPRSSSGRLLAGANPAARSAPRHALLYVAAGAHDSYSIQGKSLSLGGRRNRSPCCPIFQWDICPQPREVAALIILNRLADSTHTIVARDGPAKDQPADGRLPSGFRRVRNLIRASCRRPRHRRRRRRYDPTLCRRLRPSRSARCPSWRFHSAGSRGRRPSTPGPGSLLHSR